MTADLSVPQRQSPFAIVFLGLRIIRSLGLTQLVFVIFFVVRGPFAGALVIIPSLAILLLGALSAVAWWRYTFQLVGGELVVVKGVIRMNRLTVPVQRIQSVAIDQTFFHRLTGLVKVTVDTAGSSAAEFEIDAVSREIAEDLQRAAVTTAGHSPLIAESVPNGVALPPPSLASAAAMNTALVPPVPAARTGPGTAGIASSDDRVVFTHDPWRLFITAITMWPLAGLIVLGPIFALGDEVLEQIVDRIPLLDDVDTTTFRWWFVPVGLAAFALFSIVLNIVRVFLQDWQLTLRVTPTSLRRASGLLSRTSTASSVARMQVISSSQNLLQRRAGLQVVGLSNVGEGDLALPGCDDEQFATVTRLAGSTPIDQLGLSRRIHPAEIWLKTRNAVLQAAAIALAGSFVVGWWSTVAVVLVPIVWLMQRRHIENFRWALGTELATFTRVIDTATQQTVLRKANAVRITQSIFERRRGLGRVHLATAAGTVSVGMLPIAEARAVRDVVLLAAETDRRSWM